MKLQEKEERSKMNLEDVKVFHKSGRVILHKWNSDGNVSVTVSIVLCQKSVNEYMAAEQKFRFKCHTLQVEEGCFVMLKAESRDQPKVQGLLTSDVCMHSLDLRTRIQHPNEPCRPPLPHCTSSMQDTPR
jgi:hypothetical protein